MRHRPAVRDIPEQVTALLDSAAGPAGEAGKKLASLLSLRLWALYHLNELSDSAAQAIAVGEPLATDFEQVLGPGTPDATWCPGIWLACARWKRTGNGDARRRWPCWSGRPMSSSIARRGIADVTVDLSAALQPGGDPPETNEPLL